MSDVFLGGGAGGAGPGGGGIFGRVGGGGTGGGYAGGGVDVEGLERTGRRMTALQSFAPEFVTSSPSAALALAEGGLDDDEVLRSATEAVGFANVERLRSDLRSESTEVQRSVWAGLPEPLRDELTGLGYRPPSEEREEGGGSRFGINLPDFLPGPDELTLPDETPVLGQTLGALQHGAGEALEGVGDVGSSVLDGFAWLGEETMHAWRSTWLNAQRQGVGGPLGPFAGGAVLGGLTAIRDPMGWKRAWDETGKEDHYVRPEYESRARRLLSGNQRLYDLAVDVAAGRTPEEIVAGAGFEPGSTEAGELVTELVAAQSDAQFRRAVHQLSVGAVSFGRVVTQGLGLNDTDAGLGRIVSGTLDAGFSIAADPTLVVGGVTKAARFGRWAFTLENADDLGRGYRLVDAAMEADRARRGVRATTAATGPMRAADMRRGQSVLRWADRVAEGFATGSYSSLMRDLPTVGTALDTMVNAHTRRVADGLRGLDDATGVLEWLRDRDGLLALASTRLGGASPMTRGLRIPALTTRDRAVLATRKAWTSAIDWSSAQYAPEMRRIIDEVGSPTGLARSAGQFVVSQTVGHTGRLLNALTTHAPYKADHIPLFGDEAVAEFGRLVNAGAFGQMSRAQMDDYVDAFAKGNLATRSTLTEAFVKDLFERTGVADTKFAEQWVGRMHQSYATGGGDSQLFDAMRTKGARLVDAQHGAAMAIPELRDILRASRRTNLTRFMFHNTPASWADAALGRAWKPSVLMRIGFIPRAAGEELLHYALKHGPRSWLGAKGADWTVQAEVRGSLDNQLREAIDAGDDELAEQLRARIAGTGTALAPLRGLASATDRMWMRAWDGLLSRAGVAEDQAWRNRLITKAHNLDEKGVVSGLERFSNQLTLRQMGLMSWAGDMTRIPSKAQIGEFLARKWNPDALLAARMFVEDPTVARAFASQIAGGTLAPQEFRGIIDESGRRVRKVVVNEMAGGRPILREVEMRPVPGEYRTLSRGLDQDPMFLDSVYTRQQALYRGDRVGEKVVADVLPRWTGGKIAELGPRLGYGDAAELRRDLNTAWAPSEGVVAEVAEEGTEEATEQVLGGPELLRVVRDYVDGEDFDDARRGWLARELDRHFGDTGTSLRGRQLLDTLDETDAAARHWMLYEDVNPDWLTDDFDQLMRQMRHAARGRLARPDMYRHLRESRLYQMGDQLAVPAANGISKVYVPLAADDIGPLGGDFVEAATAHIRRIGGYGEQRARRIAQRVADASASDEAGLAAQQMTQRPVAAWGANDPRIAEAVMAGVEEVTGVRPSFGILEVPDDAIQRSAGRQPVGLHADADAWEVADDFFVDAWRLGRTRAVDSTRRLTQLEVDNEWWDEVELNIAREAYGRTPAGQRRIYTTNHRIWGDEAPTDRPFWFANVPADLDVARAPLDVIQSYGTHKLPAGAGGEGWEPMVVGHQRSEGLGEIDALERVAEGTVDEALDILSTYRRTDIDDDILHEVVEPLLRPNRAHTDEAGNTVIEPGYSFNHLVYGTKVDRLPWESYGQVHATARDSTWSKFVSEWFSGPVDHAVSAVIRKPMFLDQFGKQLRYGRGVADLFVDPEIHAAAARAATKLGLDRDALDTVAVNARHAKVSDILADMVDGEVDPEDAGAIADFAGQRIHGLDLARDNALNRAMQLTVPFIDDHRVRSQFQQYVGNFMPFQFAEEQFLKRWARSISESPEMIRKAQLMMNGFRSMGVVRKDSYGNEIFVYPGAGEATAALSKLAAPLFGDNLRVPYAVAMTGQVGYTLPGIGDQVGVPSVGPLVAAPLELLSRHFPEIADIERRAVGRGADQPLWRYFVPSGGAKLVDAMFGDVDSGQLASATSQAILTMSVNGQAPPEGATPAERQEFIDRARGQARFILAARAVFGMTAPAAPQATFRSDELNAEFNELLAAAPIEQAVQAFLAKHPEADAADLLAATVPTTEQEFGGLDLPTEAAANWMEDNAELIAAYPAAASWLMPRAGSDDKFSTRAWTQQFAVGLRRRKAPDELLSDVYFQAASRDYFDERTAHESRLTTLIGPERAAEMDDWANWKRAYFAQHPVFESMLADPTRSQRRGQAVSELAQLSAREDGPVPAELATLMERYEEYRAATSIMRGDRRTVVENRRREMTEEFSTWALWHIERHPWLSAVYLRLIEPDLSDLDEDAAAPGALTVG